MSTPNLNLFEVTFQPRVRKACEATFLILEFSESSAIYLAWTMFKQSGFDPKQYRNRPKVAIKPRETMETM